MYVQLLDDEFNILEDLGELTPKQALFTLNEAGVFEASGVLVQLDGVVITVDEARRQLIRMSRPVEWE